MKKYLLVWILALTAFGLSAQSIVGISNQNTNSKTTSSPISDYKPKLEAKADAIQAQVVTWRRDFHEHPELGNREFRTSGIIRKYLTSLGLEVLPPMATTGVVAILKGAYPGPVVGLRADIDGLPITERTPVPFASKVKTTYNGNEVGVMHACGHDTHTAILMGVAKILSEMKADIHGTVKFIFQPAEEGVPAGEHGGAEELVKQGVLNNPKVDVIFGLHIEAKLEVGKFNYRPGGAMAAVNDFKLVVTGRSSHGAQPWSGIDPIVISAEIINNLQTIVSRNIDLTKNPAVVTVGAIRGGNRSNIIPESVEMLGTLRALSESDMKILLERVRQVATKTAEAQGGNIVLTAPYSTSYPVTYNDPELTAKMIPTLLKLVGKENVILTGPRTGAEDFSFYQQKVPGLYVLLGGLPKGSDPSKAADHHTPDFYVDESGFSTGVKALAELTLDYMNESNK